MTLQPHKEERFMFVVYPMICYCGALSLSLLQHSIALPILSKIFRSAASKAKVVTLQRLIEVLVWILCSGIVLLSIARIASIAVNYSAPVHLYSHLSEVELQRNNNTSNNNPVNVCVGKEWYRFPSNFFLPHSHVHLQFLPSGFKGQLPKPYSSSKNATWIIPTDFNDLNREEPSRYVELESCDYLVDLEFEGQVETRYSMPSNDHPFQVIHWLPFLDASHSHPFFRAFYVPGLSAKYTAFNRYYLFRKNSKKNM